MRREGGLRMARHRNLALLVALVMVTALLGSAVAAVAAAGRKSKSAASVKKLYVCTKCQVGSTKAGKCPICKGAMKQASYACMACDQVSDKPGACPACGKPMVKVADASKKCPECGYYHAKTAKTCP